MSTKQPKVPVVIVGMGWARGIIASELTKAGVKVVWFERGKDRTTSDYLIAHDELRYQSRTELMKDLSKKTITSRNNKNITALTMCTYGTFIVGDGVGGAGSHWNGQTYRFLPYDFEIKTTVTKFFCYIFKFFHDWRLNHWTRRIWIWTLSILLNGFTVDPSHFLKFPYVIPSSNLYETYKNPDGIQLGACQYCAYCENFGCECGAKADPAVTVIPEQSADIVVVASYVFNNVWLLLNSGLGKPYNPETGKGAFRKNYCYQVTGGGSTLFFNDREFNLYGSAGALGMEIPDFEGDNFDHTNENFIHGGCVRVTQYGNRPITNNKVRSGTRSWGGAEFKKQSIKYANSTFLVMVQAGSMPHKDNYLDLDPTYKNAYGMPLLQMTYDYTEQDREIVKYRSKISKKIAQEFGADIIETSEEQAPFNVNKDTNTYYTGGVIMGAGSWNIYS